MRRLDYTLKRLFLIATILSGVTLFLTAMIAILSSSLLPKEEDAFLQRKYKMELVLGIFFSITCFINIFFSYAASKYKIKESKVLYIFNVIFGFLSIGINAIAAIIALKNPNPNNKDENIDLENPPSDYSDQDYYKY